MCDPTLCEPANRVCRNGKEHSIRGYLKCAVSPPEHKALCYAEHFVGGFGGESMSPADAETTDVLLRWMLMFGH